MYKVVQNIIIFATAVLLQLLLFNNMSISVYIHPMVYLTFIILLPINLAPIWVLLCGLMIGVMMDLGAGTAGLNTIATLFVAYARPLFLRMSLNRDEITDGKMPTSGRLGFKGYLRYSGALIFVHGIIIFSFETLSWDLYHLTLLRVLLSCVVTIVLCYFFQLVFVSKE